MEAPLRAAYRLEPRLNDGVRMNIRPFVQAGILRKNPNIKWTKDRGNEPQRQDEYPWFWAEDRSPVMGSTTSTCASKRNNAHGGTADEENENENQSPGVSSSMSLFDFCEHTRLGDLFEIKLGVTFIAHQDVDPPRGIPVIRGSDLARDQIRLEDFLRIEFDARPQGKEPPIAYRRAISKESDISSSMYLKPGDLLLPTVTRSPRCFMSTEDWGPCLPNHSVIVLRRKIAATDPEPIRQFLSSSIGFEGISARASILKDTVIRITPSVLSDLTIPIVPYEVTDSLAEADQIERTIAPEAVTVRTMRQRILSADSLDQLHASLNVLKSQLLAIKYGLLQSADLSYRIRNYYPFPLSYPYRILQGGREKIRVLERISGWRPRYRSHSFPHWRSCSAQSPRERPRNEFLSSWKGKGATFGSWMGVLSEAASKFDASSESVSQVIETTNRNTRQSNALHHLCSVARRTTRSIPPRRPTRGFGP